MIKFGRKCDMWKNDVNSTAYFPENERVNRENWVVVVVSTKGWNIPVIRRGEKGELSAKSISRTVIIQLERRLCCYVCYLENICRTEQPFILLHVRESGFQNLANFCLCNLKSSEVLLWNEESWHLESGLQLKESGIPLEIRIRKTTFTDKETKFHYQEPGIHSMDSRIQDCFNWIPLHGATLSPKLRSTIT